MILVFGSLNIDLVARVPVIPGPGRTVLASSYETHFGGKGANQAVAAARIAGAEKVAMAGCVGKDGFGDRTVENLERNGVAAGLIVRAPEPTGCAFITVDGNGENAITVASGANMSARSADLPEAFFAADTVLVLQMEVPFAQSLEAARRTKAARGTVIWNFAPVPEKMTGHMVGDMLATTDYLVVNEHEALDLTGTLGVSVTDFEIAARELARSGRLVCVVTAGAEGAFAFAQDGGRIHVPALKIVPIDTTGAGDTFVGAFACLISEKAPLPKALEVACEAAAQKCLKRGAQDGMPVRSALKALKKSAQ
jgi:ribokinase